MESPRSRAFGPDGPPVPVVGQGTWKLEKSGRRAAVEALRYGLDLGLTHIDTAEMYGSGEAESIVGEAIEGRREEVFLVSKVLPQHASRRGTIEACEQSLARLRTDRLDVYLLHWRGAHPLAETVEAFESLERSGKIRRWGVSNFDVDDLEELETLTGSGSGPVCNQVLYHLAERAIEHALIAACKRRDIAVVAYTPFGESARIYEGRTAPSRVLAAVAARHGATPRQAALAFLLRHPGLFVIPKAISRAHLDENAAAASLRLTTEDIHELDAAFPLGSPGPLPMI